MNKHDDDDDEWPYRRTTMTTAPNVKSINCHNGRVGFGDRSKRDWPRRQNRRFYIRVNVAVAISLALHRRSRLLRAYKLYGFFRLFTFIITVIGTSIIIIE